MSNPMELHEIVMKLVGSVNPVGETNLDNQRFENLKVLQDLIDKLVSKIDNVACRNKNSHEFSRKRAADSAAEFLTKTLGIE